jgi:hypothetical protein
VRKAKRKYWYEMQQQILKIHTTNKSEFWKKIGQLGVGQARQDIPLEIVTDDGTISADRTEVIGVWKNHFQGLLNHDPESVGTLESEVQNSIAADSGVDTPDKAPCLNEEIAMLEVIRALYHAKNGKPRVLMKYQ